ncbi:MAG: ABC transporter substrate-binding protein [Arcanobacterium sp.]|nr:ABC transporter substrate-binding protein [Arcanobacterium sp.]
MKHRLRIYLATVGAGLLALTGCAGAGAQSSTPAGAGSASAPATSQDSTFTVGLTYVPDIQFAPLYVAQANGYFAQHGLTVKLRHHGAQEALLGALAAGTEDVVFAGGDEMLQGRSTGIDVVNWATMYQQYPVVLIAAQDSGVTSWAELTGKTVGIPGEYGENYYGLLAALKAHGLSGKVTVKSIGYTQAAALHNKQVDAVIGFSNNDVIAIENAGVKVNSIPLMKGELPLIGVGFGSLSSNIRPKVYREFLAAVNEGVQAAKKDPQAALAITEKQVPSLADPAKRAVAKKVLEATLALYEGDGTFGQQDAAKWESMAKFMLDQGLIKKAVPAADAFTTAVVAAS